MTTTTTSTSRSPKNLGFTVLAQSKAELHSDPNQGGKYDILRLLAVTRDLNIDILPHQRENWLGAIGQGGSAIINQAFANLKTSFAFKCFQDDSEENGYKAAIQEMSVLGLSLLLDQPNIVQLQGVSFEVTSDESVRPMLIYEKSKHRDLFKFAGSPAGKELGLPERMAICKDIGSAILFMHSCNIIHGDIKPQNVLIFEEEGRGYCAKVTDFGYSTVYAHPDSNISMPMSYPWNPPEQDRNGRLWTPSEAKSMDIFSFGMLCVWFLSERSLADLMRMVYETVRLRPTPSGFGSENDLKEFLEFLKSHDLLPTYADAMMNGLATVDASLAEEWREVFRRSLSTSPKDRNIDGLSLFLRESEPHANHFIKKSRDMLLEDFDIRYFFLEFYQCDYRLRSYVYRCIKEECDRLPFSSDTPQLKVNMEIQRAVCLWYGFGIAMNKSEASDILNRVGKVPADINTTLPWEIARAHSLGSLIKAINNAQEISPKSDFGGFSLEDIEKATNSLLQDLYAIEENFDRFNSLWLTIAIDLVHLNFQRERWNQVQELLPKCIEVSEAILGQGNAETMNLLHRGALMYRKLRQWTKAEEMELQSCKGSINIRSRITSDLRLASIYRGQGRLQDAEEIELKVVEWRTAILGEDNNDTRMAMRNLNLTYLAQKKFQEAKKLALKVLEMDERIMGRDHLDTLITESHLGSIYFYEKRYPEAKNKWLDVLDRKSATLGPHHPSTCTTMENLAWVYKEQGMLDEAKEYAQKSVLAYFSQYPPGAIDAITICIQVWQQSLGAGAQYILPQGDDATPEMYRAYLLARPEFDARVEEVERLQGLNREMMMQLIWYNHSTVV